MGSGPGDCGLENSGSRAHVNVHKATMKNWLYAPQGFRVEYRPSVS